MEMDQTESSTVYSTELLSRQLTLQSLTLYIVSSTHHQIRNLLTLGTSDTGPSIVILVHVLVAVVGGTLSLPVVGLFEGDFVNVGLLGELGRWKRGS
jgi:hypothetical protein